MENVLHLLFYMLKKEKAKKDVLGGGKDFLFMMVSICRYLFFAVIIKE